MNKTISITLNGMLFNLEEAAYEKLSAYLRAIRHYLQSSDGRDEIISDVEGRIAELFTEKLRQKQVILEAEVTEIISIMGQPEAYADGLEADEPIKTDQVPESAEPRRLFRDPDEGVLAGVCTGIGYYFGIDPVWLRVAFLVVFFFGGSGIILYLILWIAMPKAKSRSEKLQMRGQPVNLETLEKGFKDEMDRLNQKAGEIGRNARNKFNGSGLGQRIGNFIRALIFSFARVFRKIFAWLARFIGFIFLMTGIFAFFIWLMIVLGFGDAVSVSGDKLDGNTVSSLFDLVFSHPWQSVLFSIGLAVLFLSPILALFFAGVRLIFPKRFLYRWPGALSAGLFIIGIITCIVCGAFVIRDFRSQGKIIQTIPLSKFSSDTINVISNPAAAASLKRSVNIDGWQIFFNDDDEFIMGKVRLEVSPAEIDKPDLQVVSAASGTSKRAAVITAENLTYYVKQKGDTLLFNPWFRLKEGSHWRGQEVEFRLRVPAKTYFRFDNEIIRQVNDLYVPADDNTVNTSSWLWKPGQDRIECVNCPENDAN
jgi:phage shock protein PspC (stress-responsive transcriptional regulator)